MNSSWLNIYMCVYMYRVYTGISRQEYLRTSVLVRHKGSFRNSSILLFLMLVDAVVAWLTIRAVLCINWNNSRTYRENK